MHATAAFFRLEGALAPVSALGCAAWMAAGQADLAGRVGRAAAAMGAGLAGALRLAGTDTAATLAWQALAGCSEDRLVVLAEGWYEAHVADRWRPHALDLLAACRRQGQRLVLLSDHPDLVARPAAAALGFDDLVCNALTLEDGRATGALTPPAFTGRVDGTWIRAYATRHGLDPAGCSAYGAHEVDATLLSAVGRPCAVSPDRALRRLARTFDWPIVEAR